ncbi:TPA: accessory Sec system protein translocase subunit SecY2 [Streptococcus suis]|nr:accessory Sec system protein translocase subunit SecY2 [Streptococcus suis]HEM5252795.1 accessory Sec system protein translocase subunit SecY2 [Streptococcus suis]
MNRLLHKVYRYRKFILTFIIILTFILGRRLLLPLVDTEKVLSANEGFLVTDYSTTSLFSLGLGPWMYATILMSLFTIRKTRAVSPQMMNARKNGLQLLIATIQGLGLAISLPYQEGLGHTTPMIFMVTLMTIAGSFVVGWLIDTNAAYGIGGSALIVLVNIILGQFSTFPVVWDLMGTYLTPYLWFWLFWILLTIYIIVVFEKAEYRVPVQRVSIKNHLAEEAYMPIKLFISGGMPFMYAFTLLGFPPYLFLFLSFIFPQFGDTFSGWNKFFSMMEWEGIIVYLIILYVLTISFAFINLNPRDKADEMRQSGDFISGVRPGKETVNYLSRIVGCLGHFNAIYLIIMSGIPLFIAMIHPELRAIAGLPGVIMMTAGIILGILLEFKIMLLKKRYRPLFDSGEEG